MKKLILSLAVTISTLSVFSQSKYNFDKPWRAKSNEGIYEWYIEHLDDTCDSLLNELFYTAGVSTDSIQWKYPANLFDVFYENGSDYYSRKVYYVNTKDKYINSCVKNESVNKLPNRLFELTYLHNNEGVTTLILIEYY